MNTMRFNIRSIAGFLALAMTVALLLGSFASMPLKAADNKKYPILLIHGIASDSNSWRKLPDYLRNKGYDVFVMDFNEWADLPYANRSKKDFHMLAAVIARQTSMIRNVTGAEKINVIAHSIAGVAVRAYMAGWGKKIENRGRYGGDLNRVIYLCAPHFGSDRVGPDLKQMLKDTDYGKFMDHNTIMNSIRFGAPELMEINDWHMQYGSDLGVEELTVYSDGDHIVKNYSANLDGTRYNPFFIPRPSVEAARESQSMHVTLRKYDHATHVLLGNTQVTILGVGQKKHPVLKIATNFFPGEGGWRSVRSKIRQSRDSLVFLRVARGTGIDLGSFTPGALSLKKVTAKKRKNVKMTWNPKSEAFFFTKMNSGTYELSYPPAGNYALRFDLNIMDGTSQFATFDPKNLPFDPEYQMQPGDESIAPGDIPSAITDYRSLRRFVLAAFPFESRVYKTRNQHITLTRQIYSSLLATYPNLKKDGDIDKFAMSETLSIDWIKDFKSDGVLANKLVWQEIIKEEPKDPGDGGGGGGGIPDGITIPKSEPSEVYNLTTLREFALYHFGAQLFVYQTPNVQGLAKQVRDKIVARYSRYFLPWSDSNVRHFDAFADRIAVTTIDFVTASSAPGQLYYKLTWSVHEDPWWAK